MSDKLNSKESLYGFIAWLTTRKQITVMSSKHDCAGLPELIEDFSKTNKLSEISKDWPNNLIHPSGECSHAINQPVP